MPQKVLLISYNYAPELTGIGKYNAELCEYLATKHYAVKVITAYPYYPNWKVFDGYANKWYNKEQINGVVVVRCPFYIPTNPSGRNRILQELSFYASTLLLVVWQIVSFKRYDIIITPLPSFICGFHGILFKFFNPKTKFVYHIQDLQIDAAIDLNIIHQKWLKKLIISIEQFILNQATIVSTISEGMQKKILAKKARLTEVVVFPNWVDNAKIFVTEPNLATIASLGIPLNKKIFFYSGAIGEKQGLEIIVSVAQDIAVKCPDVLFVISGSGPYKDKLQAIVAEKNIENIMFIALQPINIFNQLLNYAYCHLIIQKESVGDLLLPSKLTNILAVGGVSIIAALPNTTLYDVIIKNEMGIIVPPEDDTAFKNAINTVITKSDSLKATISSNASKYAATNLNKANVIDKFMSTLKPPKREIRNFRSKTAAP
jgi:colanic acid biosynthesis glycosyl transferase WcaI